MLIPKYSIIIPTYNHCNDFLVPCIDSIRTYTDLSNIEIIVVANGCTDNTLEYLKANPDIDFLWFYQPLGFTKSVNFGMTKAKGDYVIIMNNDVELLSQEKNHWLNLLEQPFTMPSTGISGVLRLTDTYSYEEFLVFFCVMISRKVIDTIGLLDPIYSPGFGEDIDYCIRAKQAGFQLVNTETFAGENTNVGSFPIWHKDNGTFSEMSDYSSDIVKRNGLINAKKYNKHLKLNLGAGPINHHGYLSIDKFDEKAQIKMDAIKLDFDDNSVEEIMAIHLLEHINPHVVPATLKEWLRVLKPNGKLILELPDIEIMCRYFLEGDKGRRYDVLNGIYCPLNTSDTRDSSGNHDHSFITSSHVFGWYPEILGDHLAQAGFTNIIFPPIQFWHSDYDFRCEATKPVKQNERDFRDENTYREIFIDNGYELFTNEVKDKTVIDIGANKGLFSQYASSLGAKIVYSVEPEPTIFEELKDNLKYTTNCLPMNYAVTNEDDGVVNIEANGVESTIYHGVGAEAQTKSLKGLLDWSNTDHAVLKMDCEGAEYDIILGADQDTLSKIDIIVMEHHTAIHPEYIQTPEVLWKKLISSSFICVVHKPVFAWDIDSKGQIHNHRPMNLIMEKWIRTPTVHIVTPTHARLSSLRYCIESVQAQTYQNFVHHICSDGYDENVELMVAQLNDPRFVYDWTDHEGACGGLPRKSVIDNLDDNRDYVCFLDDDNELYKDYLFQMVHAITEEHKLAVCKINHDKFGIMPEVEDITETSVKFGKIDSLCFMTTVNLAKQFANLWIHNPMKMVTHDYDFPTAILTKTKLKYIPIVLGNHGQNI